MPKCRIAIFTYVPISYFRCVYSNCLLDLEECANERLNSKKSQKSECPKIIKKTQKEYT